MTRNALSIEAVGRRAKL